MCIRKIHTCTIMYMYPPSSMKLNMNGVVCGCVCVYVVAVGSRYKIFNAVGGFLQRLQKKSEAKN